MADLLLERAARSMQRCRECRRLKPATAYISRTGEETAWCRKCRQERGRVYEELRAKAISQTGRSLKRGGDFATSADDVQDAVSDGVLSLLEYWQPTYEGRFDAETERNFAAKHVRDRALTALFKENQRRTKAEKAWLRMFSEESQSQENADAFLEIEYQLVLYFVPRLEKIQRRIIEGHYWHNLTFSDLSNLVGCSERWCRKLHRRALDTLKAQLRFWMPSGTMLVERWTTAS